MRYRGRPLISVVSTRQGYSVFPFSPAVVESVISQFDGRIGHDDDARTILLAKLRRHRSQQPVTARMWGCLQDGLVGYGYRPTRAAIWLLALTVAGTVVFHFEPPQPVLGAAAAQFNTLVYTLDLVVPILDLGQEHAFAATGVQQWFAYALIAMGWILFTAVAAALTRNFSRS